MAATKITSIQLLALYVGGRDGGVIQAASTAASGKVIHMIECLEADTTFTVLAGVDADGSTARNYITDNGYSGVALPQGTLVCAAFGGKISSFTADKAVRYFRLPNTSPIQND
jgi:hypothetical protein